MVERVCGKISSVNTVSAVRGDPFERRDPPLSGWNSDAVRPGNYATLYVSCRK